jgi:hypothetical protein
MWPSYVEFWAINTRSVWNPDCAICVLWNEDRNYLKAYASSSLIFRSRLCHYSVRGAFLQLPSDLAPFVRFQVLTAASMMFRVVFWDILPCKLIVDRHPWWWRQYAPLKRRSTINLYGSISQKTTLNITGTFCFHESFSTLCGWLVQRQGYRVEGLPPYGVSANQIFCRGCFHYPLGQNPNRKAAAAGAPALQTLTSSSASRAAGQSSSVLVRGW